LNIQNNNEFSPENRTAAPKGIVSVPPRKTSEYLCTGDQAKLIDAAVLAETWGYPINHPHRNIGSIIIGRICWKTSSGWRGVSLGAYAPLA
jgi:hypothetical protein